MGSFSWLKADNLTKTANIVSGASFRFLIPAAFGGGSIKEHYQDYGQLGDKEDRFGYHTYRYDMYELLAFWNADHPYKEGIVRDYLKWDGEFVPMKENDGYTDLNRRIGIAIGCYDKDMQKLKYPLKLVSSNYKGSYEDCVLRSFYDPCQGFFALPREKLPRKGYITVDVISLAMEYGKCSFADEGENSVCLIGNHSIRIPCHTEIPDPDVVAMEYVVDALNNLRYGNEEQQKEYGEIRDILMPVWNRFHD